MRWEPSGLSAETSACAYCSPYFDVNWPFRLRKSFAEGRVISPPSNAAWLCRQFVLAANSRGNEHVDVAFAHALGIESYVQGNPDQYDLVRAAISSLRKQQRAIIAALSLHATVTVELYTPIQAVDAELSAMNNLHQALRNFPQFSSGEYPLALGWAANVLPSSGYVTNAMETAKILNDIIELRSKLTSMRFPPAVNEFLEQLLKELENGVITASFEGAASLHRACRNAVSEIAAAEDHLRSAVPDLNEAQRSYLSEAADKVEKVGKIAGGFSAAIEFAQKLVPLVLNSVPNS